jgi:hypothetical protein
MKIRYTKKTNDNILINNIEDTPDWDEIEKKYGVFIRYDYFSKAPFYFYTKKNDSMHIYGHIDEKLTLFPLRIGEEYTSEYFKKCKKLIIECDKRLHHLKKQREEQWVWDSRNIINIKL